MEAGREANKDVQELKERLKAVEEAEKHAREALAEKDAQLAEAAKTTARLRSALEATGRVLQNSGQE